MATGITVVATEVGDWSGTNVDVATISSELSKLWSRMSRNSRLTGAVRTSIFNLVVYTSPDCTERISDALRQLSQRHPSRAIVLVGERMAPNTSVDASIAMACQSSTDRRLCYEEIRITGHGRAADHLESVVIPLLLPELPTYLWWPGQPPFGHRVFHRLLSVANQLVIDSGEFGSPGDGFANLSRVVQGQQGVNDVFWSRLAPWREVLAQCFDGPSAHYAQWIRSVRVEFGAGGNDFSRVSAGLLLMLGWIGSELGWEPESTLDGLITQDSSLTVVQGGRVIPIDLQFRDHGNRAAGRLMAVELVSQPRSDPPARFTVSRTDDLGHAHVTVAIHESAEVTRVVPLDIRSDAQLLADELQLAGWDYLYHRAVERAARLSGREIGLVV